MSDKRQQVVFSESLIGLGALPEAHHAHQVLFETGMSCRTSVRRSKRVGSAELHFAE